MMKIDKKALHEATVATTLALPINWFLSFFVLQILLWLDFQSAFFLSLIQVIVLTIFSVIRKYFIRVNFKRRAYENTKLRNERRSKA